MRPQRRAVDLLIFPGARNRAVPQPLGVVGVIVPWNFPINLTFSPLTSIFAAGNRAMVKLSENSPRISCARGLASFGFRRRFTVKSSTGGVLYSYAYWTNQRQDFFRWLANKAEDPDWRVTSGRLWSDGVAATALRPD